MLANICRQLAACIRYLAPKTIILSTSGKIGSGIHKADRSYQRSNVKTNISGLQKPKFHYNPRINSKDYKAVNQLQLLLEEQENKIQEINIQNSEIRSQVRSCLMQRSSSSASNLQECLTKKSYIAELLELLHGHYNEKTGTNVQEQEHHFRVQEDDTDCQRSEIGQVRGSPQCIPAKKLVRATRTPSDTNLMIDLKKLSSKSHDFQSLSRTADTTGYAKYST